MILSVTDIEIMDRAALIDGWSDIFGAPVPKRLSTPFLRRFLAYEVQCRELGGLPKGFVAELGRAVRTAEVGGLRAPDVGGRLIREWNGTTHIVDVVENGFLWNGERYASLSPIARAITGARWSGPRFFGLRTGAS